MIDKNRIRKATYELISALDDDPNRNGLIETPDRVANMYEELFSKTQENPKFLLKYFEESTIYDGIVTLKDIEFCSICEHHLLPFYGKVNISYMPEKTKIIGLSKIARIVDYFSKKLQLQERLTTEIADFLEEEVSPRGVLVEIEATHMCMKIRGVKKSDAKVVTKISRGEFKCS